MVEVPDQLAERLLASGTAVLRSAVDRAGLTLGDGERELVAALRALQDLTMSACGPVSPDSAIVDTAGPAMTAYQVAGRLGCSERHARRLARAGRLPATKVGRDWIIHMDQEAA